MAILPYLGVSTFPMLKLDDSRESIRIKESLGRLLMDLRDNGKLDYSLPDCLTDFSDLL